MENIPEEKLKFIRYQAKVTLENPGALDEPMKLLENTHFLQVVARELKDFNLDKNEQKEIAKKVIEEETAKLKKENK